MKRKLPRRGRSNAVKVKADGFLFDSKMEYRRYLELVLMQKAGKIQQLMVHPKYPITIKDKLVCHVELDFAYVESLAVVPCVYEDVKGHYDAMSRLKHKLVEAMYGFKVTLVRKVR